MKKFIFGLIVLAGLSSFASESAIATGNSNSDVSQMNPPPYNPGQGSYYDWGTGKNGYGYCYQWSNSGQVLNGGSPQPNYLCEQRRQSYYMWNRAYNGYGYCYQYTPYGVPMNAGASQPNYLCEQRNPSYYAWGRGQDGYTRCYQYTSNGIPMNQGAPVGNYLCQ